MQRRDALLAIASATFAALAPAACGGATTAPRTAEAHYPPLHLSPASDLLTATMLVWMIDARPREIFGNTGLIPAVHAVVSEESFSAFAARNGGVDLRQLSDLAYASYPEASLVVVRGGFDPVRIEQAFRARAEPPDGRALDAGPAEPRLAPITRLWGTVHGHREQLAIFGRDAVALERGHFGPLRTAEAFAHTRLKKSKPALREAPLLRAAELLGDAPLRGFAPGPFEGEWGSALGGLVKASTAVAFAVRPAADAGGVDGKLDATLLLLGGWGDLATEAAAHLEAAYRRVTDAPLARLCGLDNPVDGPRARGNAEALTLEVSLDAVGLARGLRAATAANVGEIMAY